MIHRFKAGYSMVAIALPLIACVADPTLAVPRTYDFWVDVTQGSLDGIEFGGNFCYDDAVVQADGIETISVADGLSVEMLFFNQLFTASNDIDYPDFPTLTLDDGKVQRLDFWVEPGPRDNWWDLPGWDVTVTAREDEHPC